MNYKELEQKAEQALDKRVGTYGYNGYQDCHKHYKDGFFDGYKSIYNVCRQQKIKLEKANEIIISFISMLDKTGTPDGLFRTLKNAREYIEMSYEI